MLHALPVVAAACLVLAAPGAAARSDETVFVTGACPSVDVDFVHVIVEGDGRSHVEAVGEVCTTDGERHPVAVNESTPPAIPIVLIGIPSGILVPRDGDGDNVPTIAIERYTIIVHGDGRIEERDFYEVPTGLVDPDDADPDNPIPRVDPSGGASVRVGCERDAVCVSARLRGTPVDRDVAERASVAPFTDALDEAVGHRPASLSEDAIVLDAPAMPDRAATSPTGVEASGERAAVGAAGARVDCPGPATVTTPPSSAEGSINRHVGSSVVTEPTLSSVARCAVTSLVRDVRVPVGPTSASTPWG